MTDTLLWVVVDVGCIECGVDTKLVGVYTSLDAAELADLKWSRAYHDHRGFRDGGQAYTEIFEWSGND